MKSYPVISIYYLCFVFLANPFMKIEIFCNERLILLSDTRPSKQDDTELNQQFAGKKALREWLNEFERKSSDTVLTIWSEESFDQLKDTFFGLYEKVEAAGGIVFNEHEEMLFIHRNGKWDLPKGKINGKDRRKAEKKRAEQPGKSGKNDPGEQVARIAALREVKEETGLKTLKIISGLPSTYHIYYVGERRIIKHTRWFRMLGSTGDSLKPQIDEGIIIARWIPSNSLGCVFMHTYESLKPLIKSVQGNN